MSRQQVSLYIQSNMAVVRVCEYAGFIIRSQIFPGSESRARMPVLVQVGLDLAYFQTQYTKQPSCGLQARVGSARLGLTFAEPCGRMLSGSSASVPLSLIISTIAPGIITSLRRRRHHLLLGP